MRTPHIKEEPVEVKFRGAPVLVTGASGFLGANVVWALRDRGFHVRAMWMGTPGERYKLAGSYATYWDVAATVKRLAGAKPRGFVLPQWSEYPIGPPLAIVNGILCEVPDKLAVPAIRFGFVGFHLSGDRGDATFRLTHRPLEKTLSDTLKWFRIRGRVCQDL